MRPASVAPGMEEVTSSRFCLLLVVGLSAFWQLFRFTGYSVAQTLVNPPTFAAEPAYCLGLSLPVLFSIALLAAARRRSQTSDAPALAVPVALGIGCLPPAMLLGGRLLYAAHVSGVVLDSVMALFATSCALAATLLTRGWLEILLHRSPLGIRPALLCIAGSSLLSFFYAAVDQALDGGGVLLSLVASPLSFACLVLCDHLCGHPEKEGHSSVAGSPSAAHALKSRSILLLVTTSAVLFVLALSSSGSVNASALNPASTESASLRHLITMAQVLLFIAFILSCVTTRQIVYLGWITFALLFLMGLLLIRANGPGLFSFGVALVSAGGRSFELLLFILVFLELVVARHRPWVPVVLFLLPEAVAATLSRVALPALYASRELTFAGYVGPLSLGLAALFIACIMVYLVAELMRRPIQDSDPFAAVTAAARPSATPELRDPLEAHLRDVSDRYALSARESTVALLVARGYTAERIAAKEGLSINTVRTHTKNLYRKLGIHSRQELIDLAERGWEKKA